MKRTASQLSRKCDPEYTKQQNIHLRLKYCIYEKEMVICLFVKTYYPDRAAIWPYDEPIYFQKAIYRVRFHEPKRAKWFLYYLHLWDINGSLRNSPRQASRDRWPHRRPQKADCPAQDRAGKAGRRDQPVRSGLPGWRHPSQAGQAAVKPVHSWRARPVDPGCSQEGRGAATNGRDRCLHRWRLSGNQTPLRRSPKR